MYVLVGCVCVCRAAGFALLTLCPSWQEDPKSTILMADRLGLHNKIFSGFRSQWMIDSSGVARNNNAVGKNKRYTDKHITLLSLSLSLYIVFNICYRIPNKTIKSVKCFICHSSLFFMKHFIYKISIMAHYPSNICNILNAFVIYFEWLF